MFAWPHRYIRPRKWTFQTKYLNFEPNRNKKLPKLLRFEFGGEPIFLTKTTKNTSILSEISTHIKNHCETQNHESIKLCNSVKVFIIFLVDNFQRWSRGIYKNTSDHKNSPEMNELERDLIAVQFLGSNFEKQKS